ncbi:MAG: FAD-binding protein, partial [Muribaculaceae bacterium]|nr:FAD-binding protein [Muribaculaceae bacterium]
LNAPAQRMTDFVKGKDSDGELPRSSYPAGIHSARIDKLLPKEISQRLRGGFLAFDKKCKGFLTDKALLIGLESRTSSPVRIPRDPETLEHLEIKNLYPAGEGAGYAGGIVSAAIDGQRCVEAYYNKIIETRNQV